jgi:hypothetical protein
MPITPVTGLPRFGSLKSTGVRNIIRGGERHEFLPQGKIIDASLSRDPGNGTDIDVLRAGLLMGKVTSSGLYAPSMLGSTGAAYTAGTSLTLNAAAEGTEIVRRIGATGTFKIIGPATAGGAVNIESVTYSAVSSTTVTVSALSNNYVSGALVVPDDGSEIPVCPIYYPWGIQVTDSDRSTELDQPFEQMLVKATLISANLLIWPSDVAIQGWIKDRLNEVGHFVFDDDF